MAFSLSSAVVHCQTLAKYDKTITKPTAHYFLGGLSLPKNTA